MRRLLATGVALLAGFVTFFAALALDVSWRLWHARASFGGGSDVVLLLVLESVRIVATLALVGIAIGAFRRREPGHAALSIAILFFALWYAKATAYAAYPGHLQEWLARALLARSVPGELLAFLFGRPTWALAPAVAAFLAFATLFPTAPDPARVRAVHATGRSGLLREVGVVGIDVRSLAHRGTARALELGAVRTPVLALLALLGMTALAYGGDAVAAIMLAVLIGAFGLAVACLRTAHVTPGAAQDARLGVLAGAGISICLEFVAAGALSFAPGQGMAHVALALASASPLIGVAFLGRFVLGGVRRPAEFAADVI
jgi:hypothetical protein